MKTVLETHAADVAEHYEKHVIEYEKLRLESDSPVEYALTKRTLDRWIEDGSSVLDVGTGVGHYAVHLAQRGCKLHIADICPSFLELTRERLCEGGLISSLLSSNFASATDLHFQKDASVDCVLMLGPLYHLVDNEDRMRAVHEANRVLKKGGLLFAAGINRLAILHEIFNSSRFFGESKVSIETLQGKLAEYCKTGISDPSIFPPLGNAYCCTIEEFQKLFDGQFLQVDLLGLESFSAFKQKALFDYSSTELPLWLSILEQTARTAEGIASSEHILFVGKKL